MTNENYLTKNIIKSYSENVGFPVYTAEELGHMYEIFRVNPKSLDRRVFDTESMSHHLQYQVIKLINMMHITSDDLVLDAGCGNGAPTRLMAKLIGCSIKSFDINPHQIEKALDCDILEGVDSLIERSVMDAHKIDFPDETFDRVFHNETMCHWMNKKAALSELHRVLKKGGIMGFHDWTRGAKGNLNDAGGSFPGTYAEGVWFQHSIAETKPLLEEAGFVVLHCEDTTSAVDRGMLARLRELQMSNVYTQAASEDFYQKSIRYFRIMIETHYDYLTYGRFLCVKKQ